MTETDGQRPYETLVAAYEVDVRFPDVSGMEHLDMLLTRSEIARGELWLTTEQRVRVAKADRMLLEQARSFYEAIQEIANLQLWRRDENVPPAHWWWYLEKLVKVERLGKPLKIG